MHRAYINPYVFCISLILLIIFCFSGKTLQAEVIKVNWTKDFEAGAAADVHLRDDGSIGFKISKDPGGNEYLWFYFKVLKKSRKALKFTIENAAGAHQTGDRWNITRPVFSTDGRHWIRAKAINYSDIYGFIKKLGIQSVFRFESPVASETLSVAYSYPYTSEDLKTFLLEIRHWPDVKISVLGKSEENREILRIDILGEKFQKKRERIWIIGREHPGETPSSFFCEGMTKALLQSREGKSLRKLYDFSVVPMLNIDGVANGYYYHNARGVNLARDWAGFKSAEVKALKKAIIEDSNGKGVRLVINLHSSNDPKKGHFFLLIPQNRLSLKDIAIQRRILQAAEGKNPQLQSRSTVRLFNLPGITGNALYRELGVYSFYIESNYNIGSDGSIVTPETLRGAGKDLVRILSEVFAGEN